MADFDKLKATMAKVEAVIGNNATTVQTTTAAPAEE